MGGKNEYTFIQNEYSNWIFDSNKNYIRGLLISYLLFYSLYFILDYYNLKSAFKQVEIIRFTVGFPPLIVALISCYSKKLITYYRFIFPTALLLMNISISFMYYTISTEDALFSTFHSGLMLTLISLAISMSSYVLTSIFVLISAILFILVSIFKHNLNTENPQLFVQSTIFVLSTSLFCIVINFVIHKFLIRIFSFQKKLSLERDDIYDEKEKFVELNAAKDKLFSIISHDLRSPFNTLLGYFIILLQNEKDHFEVKRDDIQKIYLHIRRTYNLLNNLLTWSKSHLDTHNFSPELHHLEDVVCQDKDLFKEIAQQKNIELKYIFPKNLSVYCDLEMISTILRNLIFNAIKFTSPNGEITIKSSQLINKRIEIAVIDNGVGMSNSVKAKLLKQKEQYSTHGTANEEGSGIGLMICQDFLKKHNSKLFIDTRQNFGSKFYFHLKSTEHVIKSKP